MGGLGVEQTMPAVQVDELVRPLTVGIGAGRHRLQEQMWQGRAVCGRVVEAEREVEEGERMRLKRHFVEVPSNLC